MNHRSPIEQPDFSYLPEEERNYRIDRKKAEKELMRRCKECRKRRNDEVSKL
jgi:hypothetical protein